MGVGDKELLHRVLANKFYWLNLSFLADSPEGASFKSSLSKIVRKDRADRRPDDKSSFLLSTSTSCNNRV